MQLKLNPRTKKYYAHLIGSAPINLKTANKEEAAALAKAAHLPEIEFLARTKLLTAEAVQRLSAGGKVTGAKALETWAAMSATFGVSKGSIHTYQGRIEQFLESTGLLHRPINLVADSEVDEFVNQPGSMSTRSGRLSALNSFFKVCERMGFVVGNPTALVKVRKQDMTHEELEPKEQSAYTEEEVEKLLRMTMVYELPFWNFAVKFAWEYGFRLGDIALMEWASFAKPNKVVVHTDKTRKRLELPCSPEMLDGVLRLDLDYLWPEQAEVMLSPTRRAGLSQEFNRLCEKVGVPARGFHSLRRGFATRLFMLGESVDQIREKMAHSDSKTTEKYIIT